MTCKTWQSIWFILALLWVGATAYLSLQGMPTMPLDISAKDPATITAYNHAVNMHVIRYAVIGIVPPLLVLLIGRYFCSGRAA